MTEQEREKLEREVKEANERSERDASLKGGGR
jgi:hypothetical protein